MSTLPGDMRAGLERYLAGAVHSEMSVAAAAMHSDSPTSVMPPTAALLAVYPLPVLFGSLETAAQAGDDASIRLLCSALERILAQPAALSAAANGSQPGIGVGSSPGPAVTLDAILGHIVAGLGAGHAAIRLTSVRFIHDLATGLNAASASASGTGFSRAALYSPALLTALALRLTDPKTAVAELAGDALSALLGAPSQRAEALTTAPQPVVGSAADAVRQRAVAAAAASAPSDDQCEAVSAALATLAARIDDEESEAFGASGDEEEDEDASAVTPSLVHIRITAIVAWAAGASQTAAAALDAAGLISLLLRPLLSSDDDEDVGLDDVLLQVSTCEVIPQLAKTVMGLEALRAAPSADGNDDHDGDEAMTDDVSGVPSTSAWHRLLQWAGVTQDSDDDQAAVDSIVSSAALSAVCEIYAIAVARDSSLAVTSSASNSSNGTANDSSSGSSNGSGSLSAELLPGLCRVVQSACSSGADPTGTVSAMGCLVTALGASPHAVAYASTYGSGSLLREWLECGCSSSPELRAATYASLAAVLHKAPAALANARGAAATTEPQAAAAADAAYEPYLQLYDRLGTSCGRGPGSDTTSLLLGQLKAPIPEPRTAAYDLLSALAALPVEGALRRLFGPPQAASYLLDVGTEITKEGREWKFGVIHAAVRNPALSCLGDAFVAALRRRHARGAHAVDAAAPSVAAMRR